MHSSDKQLDELREQLKAVQDRLVDAEGERDRAKNHVEQGAEETRQLQKQAQYTERCLIVSEIVMKKVHYGATFRAWRRYVAEQRFLRDTRSSQDTAVHAAVAQAIEKVAGEYEDRITELHAERDAREAAAVRAAEAELSKHFSELLGMAQEDGDSAVARLCNIASIRINDIQREWRWVVLVADMGGGR